MQSLTRSASIKPTTVDKLEKLKEFYLDQFKGKKLPIGQKSADKLLLLLLSVVAERTSDTTLGRKLTPTAKKALELFYYFLLEGKVL